MDQAKALVYLICKNRNCSFCFFWFFFGPTTRQFRTLVPLAGIKPSAVKVQMPNHWTTRDVTRTLPCLESLKVDCPLAPISCLTWPRCGAGRRRPAVCLRVSSASCGPQRMFRGWQRRLLRFSVTQLPPTLSGPVDCSPPGFPVHGFSQARVLEWVAMLSLRQDEMIGLVKGCCRSNSESQLPRSLPHLNIQENHSHAETGPFRNENFTVFKRKELA